MDDGIVTFFYFFIYFSSFYFVFTYFTFYMYLFSFFYDVEFLVCNNLTLHLYLKCHSPTVVFQTFRW